ncbi:lon protease homolog 2, peroxisomal-like [Corticium candelabrum]|uniref:lon protease homolog 2, peroxisomal-like n=1 Tax=Corticium candelabrum TaxID=121492 RepID=UPI002E260361|nr:lon protease homolog 2, peroxisomal-like [Corticium candelabrum]XP_062501150.1 lon protease homolog 2, peroxisomal-like [Corticium candelabrum]
MADSVNKMSIPSTLPLLPFDNGVLLPGLSLQISVTNPRSMKLVEMCLWSKANWKKQFIGIIPNVGRATVHIDATEMHCIGTAATVQELKSHSSLRPMYSLRVTGFCRFKVIEVQQETPFPVALVEQLDKFAFESDDNVEYDPGISHLAEQLRKSAEEMIDLLGMQLPIVSKLKKLIANLPLKSLPDILTSLVKTSFFEKLQILDTVDVHMRLKKALPLVDRQIESLKKANAAASSALSKISGKEMEERKVKGGFRIILQPGHPLRSRQPGKFTDEVLEQGERDEDEIAELEKRIMMAKLPDYALKTAQRELKRLKQMPPQFPEHSVTRNYLELMVDLPWSTSTEDRLDVTQARLDLDVDHYGLDKVKERVIEYLAVRKLKKSLKGPILCFVGPPGVGKTSIGRSIAKTLGRKFHRISLGGICDQSDIRGHRRTYVGAMPGNIINGIKLVGVNNPVFLLDEVDKLNISHKGDPAAALLEVLDPEQNNSFTDHYLNVPFDLSQVLFVATANTTATIPYALLDRMEVIGIPGYTLEEKVAIAAKYVVPKQLDQHGLTSNQLQIVNKSLQFLISKYTREAGVRSLERQVAALCRIIAVKLAASEVSSLTFKKDNDGSIDAALTSSLSTAELTLPIIIDKEMIEDLLGPPQYGRELDEKLYTPGVAIGLAWTPMGGEIMFVEATRMPGEGKLTLTGQLGDVMKESAELALNWLRTHSTQIGVQYSGFDNLLHKTDIHIHFPAGAVGKDGPSAGVTVVVVLASLFSGRCARSDTAMTGEVTLRGRVLPVGGIKEKVLAAHRFGLSRVIIPESNGKDLRDIPESARNDLEFVLVQNIAEVLEAAFDRGFLLQSRL